MAKHIYIEHIPQVTVVNASRMNPDTDQERCERKRAVQIEKRGFPNQVLTSVSPIEKKVSLTH
uniref:Uncharacterized protein n=1 Tax=Candidatus Kentrum sp. FM TaxID=2126340 RepID=A0A450T8N1_9GAMM|nr:MAG: hypothetical protein BECKFM1743C_GA0114222_103201 [Candidatus Kentron sp. FM]VFJ63048.1 MAG: hypothetical protein BECKFM1743A_GA0114220_103231 [Candidatus Kentron sp. FM]VFK14320.1 MAG: hypothetical protein BECKFM1743B_GA0114221_103161 [Candidatus Kentron sp. FM]